MVLSMLPIPHAVRRSQAKAPPVEVQRGNRSLGLYVCFCLARQTILESVPRNTTKPNSAQFDIDSTTMRGGKSAAAASTVFNAYTYKQKRRPKAPFLTSLSNRSGLLATARCKSASQAGTEQRECQGLRDRHARRIELGSHITGLAGVTAL